MRLLLLLCLCTIVSTFKFQPHSVKAVKRGIDPIQLNSTLKRDSSLNLSRDSVTVQIEKEKKNRELAGLGAGLGLWYLISAYYNIYNKRALNVLKLPYTIATIQMAMGVFLFLPSWKLKVRVVPFRDRQELFGMLKRLRKVSFYTSMSHIAGVIALGAGTVSFTQIVKASEPIFTAFLSAVATKSFLAWQSYISLLPVTFGVALASASELSFSGYCLAAGLMSNVFASARSVFGKEQMCRTGEDGEECIVDYDETLQAITPENYYSLVTIGSLLFLLPITVLAEGQQLVQLTRRICAYMALHYFPSSAAAVGGGAATAMMSTAEFGGVVHGLAQASVSGLLFYLYNEVSFAVLSKVNPVSHALANTLKRVVIILSSVLVFGNRLTLRGQLGSALAIAGVCSYSLCQSKFGKK
jgi:solute carrier family 35 protein E1